MSKKEKASTGGRYAKKRLKERVSVKVHPSWEAFIKYCTELKYGEVARLQIQDGLPTSAESVKQRIRFP